MEEKKELGDILIGDEEALKSTQSKKMILVAAAAVVLFLMVIFSIYALTREEEKKPAPIQSSALEKADQNVPLVQGAAEENRFQQVPLQSEENLSSDDKFERIVKEIKAKQSAGATLPTPPSDAAPLLPKPIEPKREEPKPATAPVTAPKSSGATHPKSAADAFKSVGSAPVTSKSVSGGEIPKGLYVQVGSFSKFSPTSAFAQKIEQNRFAYKTQREVVNGNEIVRVLIGPYASRAEANNALRDVREKIEPKAFIKQVD